MKTYVVYLTIACAAFLFLNCNPSYTYDVALKNVTVFNSETQKNTSHQTVLIKADTIAAIVDASEKVSAKTIIEGEGRLLAPGFIDTHTHMLQNYKTSEREYIDSIPKKDLGMLRNLYVYRYLNYGITTTVDMGQPETWMDISLGWQKNPSPNYPNMFICGGSIVSDEDRRQPQHHIEVKNEADARQKVRDYAHKGIQHMKLYRKLKKSDMAAMADEAKKYNITLNTHVDNNVVTIQEAMEFGIFNFEHFFTVIPSILNYDTHWPAMNKAYGIQMSPSIDEFAAHMVFFFSYIKENPDFDERLLQLFDEMAAKGATISTALNVLASALETTHKFTSFEHFPVRKGPDTNYTIEQRKQLQTALDAMLYYIKIAHNKGVKLRIGTDSRYGGEALLEELILLHKSGIPTAELLQIASYNGYDAMKLTQKWGTIAVGKKADLILFHESPFDAIENLRGSKTIFKDGLMHTQKKSLVFDLQDILIAEGVTVAKAWYETAKNDKSYDALQEPELRMVFKEHFSSGSIAVSDFLYTLYQDHFPQGEIEFGQYITVNTTYLLLDQGNVTDAIAHYNRTALHFPKEPKTVPLTILMTMLTEGRDAAVNTFEIIKDDERYIFQESELNYAGYLLLNLNKIEEAIVLFKLNTKAFPNSSNVYDSLGEALLKNGNTIQAIQQYKKSLELNPDNENAREVLTRITQNN